MNQTEEHLRDLSEIRSLMERSSRFISLSGLSGISAGLIALVGAWVAARRIGVSWDFSHRSVDRSPELYTFLAIDAAVVLLLAVAAGVYFTVRRGRRKGQSVWNHTSRRLLVNLAIPLATGGAFCLLLIGPAPGLVAPATLVFYGLALINGSKYTHDDVRYLGICEIILGLLAGFLAGSGLTLLFWALGFGVLHLVYGVVMYRKYEQV